MTSHKKTNEHCYIKIENNVTKVLQILTLISCQYSESALSINSNRGLDYQDLVWVLRTKKLGNYIVWTLYLTLQMSLRKRWKNIQTKEKTYGIFKPKKTILLISLLKCRCVSLIQFILNSNGFA
jgi:hypothetical protein